MRTTHLFSLPVMLAGRHTLGRTACRRSVLACAVLLFLAPCGASAQNTPPNAHRAFGIACSVCHTTGGWTVIPANIVFDHEQTNFALTGKHAAVPCAGCHNGRGFDKLTSNCIGCHTDPHRSELGNACTQCHSTSGWRAPGTFILLHEATRFPLLGAHRLVECRACHGEQQRNEYVRVPFDCAGCHRKDYERASTVNHMALNLPQNCELCHKVEQRGWAPASFDHSRFPLVGKHAALPCKACHASGFHTGSVACIDCHRDDFNGAKNPDHAAGAYPSNCVACHSMNGWKPASFNHDATNFPLRGKHIGVACERCHPNNRYTGTPTDCVACHRAAYDATKNPAHGASQFPTTCASCHTVNGWTPATFDHAKTAFPLTGKHASTACSKCHVTQWAGLPTQCAACHQAEYNRAGHAAQQYPTDCIACHSTTTWKPSTFNHDARYFPINSGDHRGKWQNCATCHIVPTDYKQHSCVGCHEHAQSSMDNKHRGVKNYVFDSKACYNCHPRGNGG